MSEATLRATRELTTGDLLLRQIDSARQFPFVAESSVDSPHSAIAWLRAQRQPLRIVWSDRGEADIMAGLGAAATIAAAPGEPAEDVLQRCREILGTESELRFYGGFAFRRDKAMDSPAWRSFGSARFWLPRITYDGRLMRVVVLHDADRAAAAAAVRAVDWELGQRPRSIPSFLCRHDLPDLETWKQSVGKSLDLFQQEVLDKVVLARKATFDFSRALCPIDLTEMLAEATHACYHFCFQVDEHVAFLGATPERLFKRVGRDVISEVVAGTRRRDADESEDRRLAAELLGSGKDQLEHDIVRKSIRQRLHAHVETLQVDAQASILKLAKKQHLFSRVGGILKADVSDGLLIERLHPTPAVGGYPTENALAEIDRLEPFERGWYAGPVGWIGTHEAEFAVAIRSGLVQGKQLSLYSGAGIVPGSTAELEWEEIEHKIGDFLEIIQNTA